MFDDFDPYQKWLGIPPQEQPPNYYRLLTLKPFESDLNAIGNTSAKLTAYLQARLKGKNAAHASRLVDEVTAARACLLDPQSKRVYDLRLHRSPGAAAGAGDAMKTRVTMEPAADMSFLDDLSYSLPGPSTAKSSSEGASNGTSTGKATPKTAGKGRGAGDVPAGKSAAKGRTINTGRKEGRQLKLWQIGAIAGGGLFLLAAVVGLVIWAQSNSAPAHPRNDTVAKTEETARFGPGTFDTTQMAAEQAAKRRIPRAAISVPLRREGDFFLTAVTINGEPAGDFLVDTGAAATLIKSSVAERLKLPEGSAPQGIRAVGGRQMASFRTAETLHIGEAKFDNLQLIVIDLKPWEEQVGTTFDGILGCDVWREMMFGIDPGEQRLTFYDRGKTPLSDKAEFLTVMDDRPFITVRLDGGPEVQYMAATGCARDLLLRAADEQADSAGQGGATAKDDENATDVRSIALFGQTFENLKQVTARWDDAYILSKDPRQAGVVGGHVLAKLKIVMDFQRNKVVAQPVGAKSGK